MSPDQIEALLRQMVLEVVNKEVPNQSSSRFGAELGSSQTTIFSQVLEKLMKAFVESNGHLSSLRLSFDNEVPSTVFTGINILAENGQPLQVKLCDANDCDTVIETGPLSSALIELVVLDSRFSHGQQEEAISEENILIRRDESKPHLIKGVKEIRLKNGVASLNELSITDCSKWAPNQKFRLGARIKKSNILAKDLKIGEAVSNPFKAKICRQGKAKHHPPMGEDEVWRLEGIRKDGKYHERLSSKGIKTVDSFVRTYKTDPCKLRKMLGVNVPTHYWNAIVESVNEYDRKTRSFYQHLDDRVMASPGVDDTISEQAILETMQGLQECLTYIDHNPTYEEASTSERTSF